jgi:hypothetical protein
MRTRNRFAVLAAATTLLLMGGAPAMADDVDASSAGFQLVDGQNTLVVGVGDSATVTLTYAVTGSGKNPVDGKSGCNLSGGAGTQLVMDVVPEADPVAGAAGVAGMPATVTFESCDDAGAPATVTLSLTALSPGVTTYRFVEDAAATVGQGSFDTTGATFVVVVPDDEGRDAPAIANEWLHEVATDAELASCQVSNGTNPGQTNWHGQLISKVAQFFEGQSFGPGEEDVVIGKVRELCGL